MNRWGRPRSPTSTSRWEPGGLRSSRALPGWPRGHQLQHRVMEAEDHPDRPSLTIKQNARKDVGGPLSRLVNDWDLQLGRAPLRLKITAGAYEGEYDLSGLTLQRLTLKDGAAQTRVSFNTPNPGQMESLEYETGASSVTLIGLANANFKTMTLDGKAGDYSLDFSGRLRTDATVKIKAAAAEACGRAGNDSCAGHR